MNDQNLKILLSLNIREKNFKNFFIEVHQTQKEERFYPKFAAFKPNH